MKFRRYKAKRDSTNLFSCIEWGVEIIERGVEIIERGVEIIERGVEIIEWGVEILLEFVLNSVLCLS